MRRKPGRPRLDPAGPSVPLTVRVPLRDFDALWRRAVDGHRTLAAQVRLEFRTQKYPSV